MSVYLDTCCFIDAAKHTLSRFGEKDDPASDASHITHCQYLLDASRRGHVTLHTSTLTISECTHLNGIIDDEVKRVFRSVLTSGKVVRLVADSIFVAERARDLRWDHHIYLSPPDAIHVASALESGSAEFVTSDINIHRYAEKLSKLGLKIIRANETQQLSAYFREINIESTVRSQSGLF